MKFAFVQPAYRGVVDFDSINAEGEAPIPPLDVDSMNEAFESMCNVPDFYFEDVESYDVDIISKVRTESDNMKYLAEIVPEIDQADVIVFDQYWHEDSVLRAVHVLVLELGKRIVYVS